MFLGNLKVGVRLGLGFGVVLALMVLLAGVGLSRMAKIQDKMDGITQGNMVEMAQLYAMRGDLNTVSIAVRDIALILEDAGIAAETTLIEKTRHDYDAHAKILYPMLKSESDRTQFEKIEAARTITKQQFDKIIQLEKDNKKLEANRILLYELRPNIEKRLAGLSGMIASREKISADNLEEAHIAYSSAHMMMISLAVAALLMGVFIAWTNTRSITSPLQQALELANAVATGDLSQRIEVKTQDEFGQLLQALQDMNTSLAGIVGEVRGTTDAITTAAHEIAQGSGDLSQRTEEQASSIEELTSTVRQNADNTRQANQLAGSASDIAVKGGHMMDGLVQTMASISASSGKIADIISVIEGIAFQTNILALNAAVEAARAGEQERGFAVVASEVRNLAQRSAAAAKEITVLIDVSVDKIYAGSKQADQAGTTMNEVVAAVKRVTDIMAEIAAASSEQSAGIEEVNQAITQMDDITQQNAALAEQAAAAAEAMQGQADALKDAVGVFKLTTGSGEFRVAIANPARPVTRIAEAPARKGRRMLKAKEDKDGEWREF